MSVEERLARLETKVEGQGDWLKSIDNKVDGLVAAANMGKGAWWLILRIGGALTAVVAVIAGIVHAVQTLIGRAH